MKQMTSCACTRRRLLIEHYGLWAPAQLLRINFPSPYLLAQLNFFRSNQLNVRTEIYTPIFMHN